VPTKRDKVSVSFGGFLFQARPNDVDFTRLKANLSNTGHFARDMTTLMKVVFKHLFVKESDVGSLIFLKTETT